MGRVAVLWVVSCCVVSLYAQDPCAACHPAEVKSFARSPMSTSLVEGGSQPEGQVHHKLSDSTITIRHHGPTMVHRLQSKGLTAEYPVTYTVGAGRIGFSYLVALGPFLFQSPVSYYTRTNSWDLTPGYETERELDFTHPIAEGCLFCHAGKINLVPRTVNQFRQPPMTPISCERCHGPSEAHLRRPTSGSIVNPAKLPPGKRDGVCEQCHLEGSVRILNPGKDWLDYQPGEDLESVFVTYLRRGAPSSSVKAVSQSEELALSRCARESGGRLWCGTCHDPHSTSTNRTEEVRNVCLSCHALIFAARRHAPATECVSCHMPRIRPEDVAHAAITDHRIVIPSSSTAAPAHGAAAPLSTWREPAAELIERDLALALFEDGAAGSKRDEILRAYDLLSHLGNRLASDSEALAATASILLSQKRDNLAVSLYRQAVQIEPHNARLEYCLGVALAAEGHLQTAIAELRKSIDLDPSEPDAYERLAAIYQELDQPGVARQIIREYLNFMPQNLRFRRLH